MVELCLLLDFKAIMKRKVAVVVRTEENAISLET